MEIVLTFGGTHDVVRAEQALLDTGLPVRVMPLPSTIRAGCGLCLRVAPDDAQAALRTLAAASIPVQQAYTRTTDHGRSQYEPWEGAPDART